MGVLCMCVCVNLYDKKNQALQSGSRVQVNVNILKTALKA